MFRWYHLAASYFLFQTIGAFAALDRLVFGEWDNKGGDKLTQMLNLLAILAGLALFWQGYRTTRRINTGAWLAVALALFLLLSAFWSIDPQLSARRGLQYLLFILGVIGIANCLDGEEFMRLAGNVYFLSAVLSVVLLAASPNLVEMPDGGGLRGVFSHKSVLGQAMETGALISLYRIRTDRRKWRGILMFLVFIITTIASKSMTSLLTIFAYFGVENVILLLRRGGVARLLGIGSILLLTPIIVIGMVFPDQILEALGKDPTLTGRSDLWVYVIQFISERPILGWGLLAFWSPTNPLAVGVSTALGWVVPQAHNGLLEMLLEVGAVGTIFFLFLLIRNIIISLRSLHTPAQEIAISLLLCVGGIFLVGATEGVLLDPAEPALSLFLGMGLICERTPRSAQAQRSAVQRSSRLANAGSLPRTIG